MALFDKIKTLVGVEDDEFMEDYLDEEPIQPKPRPSVYGLGDKNHSMDRESTVWTPAPRSSRQTPVFGNGRTAPVISDRSSVLDKSAGSTLRALTQQFKIVMVEPREFEDCTKLVDNLKARKPVIVNFERVKHEVAKQIYFFLNGATYALSGKVQKIANNIFVFLPENVDVTTGADNDGMSFGSPDGNPWQR
jgi:FtsZ-interacting cell division protein YlmF